MDIERRTIVEAVAATVPVVIAAVALVFVGTTYTTDTGFSPQGGQVVVGVLAGFILLVTLAGLYLARTGD
jgi:hypothetical protein